MQFEAIKSLREAKEFANDCDMGGESCSLGGDEFESVGGAV
jgi:hypothetical protein